MLGLAIEIKEIVIISLYILLFFLVVVRFFGISNFLRFLFRYFNFRYSDREMKHLDEKWYNIQLFKVINGVNVSRIEDARLIQKGLNEGVFSQSLFMFTSSWGDVTRKKIWQK